MIVSLEFFLVGFLFFGGILGAWVRLRTWEKYYRSGPIERGFNLVGIAYKMFILQYFTILLVFLVFDLEIIFVVVIVITIRREIGLVGRLLGGFILLGLYLEWTSGKLSWKILKGSISSTFIFGIKSLL